MTVYPFGTVSSPSCANFALKRAASDHKQEFDKRTVETVKRDFYVDDCLTSAPTVETALNWYMSFAICWIKEVFA